MEFLKVVKMTSSDVKADVNQNEIKELVAVSRKILYKYILSKLEICIFHLILLGILSSLRLPFENMACFNKLMLSDVR